MRHARILLALLVVVVMASVLGFGQDPAPTPAPTDWFMIILGALFAISEILALIPGVASNSVFMLIVNILRKLTGRPPLAAAVPMDTKVYGNGK